MAPKNEKNEKIESNGSPGVEATRHQVNQNGGLIQIRCTLTGTSPLLFNAMPRDILLGLAGVGEGKPAKTQEKAQPRDIAESHIHRLGSGRIHVPRGMLYAAMINAGVFVRLDGKRQVSTKTETNLPGLMRLVSSELPLCVPDTDDEPIWEVDIQQGRNPNGGQAVCIIRPCFYKWEIHPIFEVDRKVFSLDNAYKLVEIAGRRMGLGDFRPNRRGTYGQFQITLWSIIQDTA